MAYAAIGYTGDGTTTTYSIPFDYISQSEIKVYVSDVIYRLDVDYSIINGLLSFLVAPSANAAIRIFRRTDLSKRKVEWQAKGTFTAADQNLNSKQLFFICQELYDMIQGYTPGYDIIEPVVDTNDPGALLAKFSLFLMNHTTTDYP
jgi:hypothetical protein